MDARPYDFNGEAIAPGTRRQFDLHAGRMPSGTHMSMPLNILHGARPGPVIWLSGAIHGDEIVGVEIIRSVVDQIDVTKMAGTVLAVPIVNVFGFVIGSRYLPDRRDLNRSFPGSKTGSLASRLARLFVENVVERADLGVDFHAGSDDRTNLPQIRGDMEDAETLRLSRAFGPDVIVNSKPIAGSVRETALNLGKRLLLYEGGEPNRFSAQAVDSGITGTLRLMGALDMLEEVPAPRDPPPVESASTHWVRAPRGGIFRLETALGNLVSAGQTIGVISDPTDPEYHPVITEKAGIVLGHGVNPLVHAGEGLMHVAEITPSLG